MGILKKQSGHARSLGVQNAEGEWYALAAYCPECVPKMLHLHSIGRLLLDTAIPETNAQWLTAMEDVSERASRANIATTSYHFFWVVRLHLIVGMRHHGIPKLKITTDWSHKEVAAALVPDQSEWLTLWMTSLADDSLKVLIQKLNYREPLEMLSCFACILGDSAFDQFS